ncbi:hypothetical protein SS1G_12712 [Lasallia pustulata]|uniref:Uncharacterized protein n=1 Tax=Lasallia pustulata TaxID=136370 RepID=A0A1W5DBY5_9LECA|nr:hypothetical protein SS1G_12712 [Lasallia pustulata]
MPVGTIEFHIIKADTPFLLCIADMDNLKVYYNDLENILVTPTKLVPVTHQFGHLFLLWEESLQLFIANSFDLNPLLEQSGHGDNLNKKTLEHLTKYCSYCQKHGKLPGRFKFTLQDDVNFNYSIIVDIMYIDNSPILHIVDEATRFQAAKWLLNISAKHTWDILRLCWIDVYIGPPDYITHNANALNQRNGPSVSILHDLPLNLDVLVWREGNAGRSGRWTGLFKLLGIDGETCKVELPSGPTDFRSTTVKPYLTEAKEEKSSQEEQQDHDQEEQDKSSQEEQEDPLQEHPLQPVAPHQNADYQNNAKILDEIKLFECNSPLFTESRQKEISGLLEKGVFKIIDITDVPKGIRIFNSRFINEIKNVGTDKAFEKSRLVIQVYNDYGKELVLTQSPTIQQMSQRLILAIAATLQGQLIGLDFFARPPQELGLKNGSILQVVKPLYGVPEAGNHWFNTYHHHHTEKLCMNQSTYNPCLLYTNSNGFGIVGLQTVDTLFLADETFTAAKETELQQAKLLAKEREKLTKSRPIKFNGGYIKQEDGAIILTQERQCKNPQLVDTKTVDLTSSRGEVRKAVTPKDQYVAQRA